MISAVFVMNPKGDILISRVYRDDVNKTVAAAFRSYIQEAKEIRSPVKTIAGASFLHIRVDTLFVVAVCRVNVNAAVVFELLNHLVTVFQSYFKAVTEDSIRENFVLIYELLDEVLDFGYPQYCSKEVLEAIITQGKAKFDPTSRKPSEVTIRATGAVPWRNPETRHKHNQIFIDVVESVNVLVSTKGEVLNADTGGKLLIRSELSGMPDCILGLNERAYMLAQEAKRGGSGRRANSSGIAIEDFTFHQCVRLGKFDADRTISFIPPDGEFELMKYRTTEGVSLPFRVHHNIQEAQHRIDIHLTVKSLFSRDAFATSVKVRVPVPKNTAVCRVKVGLGRAKYLPESGCVLWKIRRFPGKSESTLAAEIELIHTTARVPWSRPPIAMDFEVPMFTASGLQVRFMKVVEKSHYPAIKWVRYVTKAGSYQYRI